MKKRSIFRIVPIGGLLLLAGLMFSIPQTHAQTAAAPKFLVTWKSTASYVPPAYPGKALPSYGSKIIADVELVSNGKILNLSDQTIYWYLEDTLMGGGVGVQQLTVPLFGAPPNSLTLKIVLPSYNGQYLVHSVTIPYVNPTAVIYAPYPGGNFSSNPVSVTALSYFFNAPPSQLSYVWAVNGQTGANTESPQSAVVTLPQGTSSGTGITISLSVANPSGSATANTQSTLTYNSRL